MLSPVGVRIIQSTEKKKNGRKWNLFLPHPHLGFFSSHPIFPYPQLGFISSGLLVLRHLDLDRITPPALLGLQLTDSRLWDFSAFIITVLTSHNKIIYIYSNNPKYERALFWEHVSFSLGLCFCELICLKYCIVYPVLDKCFMIELRLHLLQENFFVLHRI